MGFVRFATRACGGRTGGRLDWTRHRKKETTKSGRKGGQKSGQNAGKRGCDKSIEFVLGLKYRVRRGTCLRFSQSLHFSERLLQSAGESWEEKNIYLSQNK